MRVFTAFCEMGKSRSLNSTFLTLLHTEKEGSLNICDQASFLKLLPKVVKFL